MAEPYIPNTLLGAFFGLIVVSLLVYVAVSITIHRRKQRNERPPQRTKLLRPSGHSLQQRIESLRETLIESVAKLVLSGVALGISVIPLIQISRVMAARQEAILEHDLYSTLLMLWVLVAGLALASSIGVAVWLRRTLRIAETIRACSLGLRGEQAVAEALQNPAIRAAGYTVYHDVPGDGDWNVDHILVGPPGIFVIETKTRSRRKATIDQEEHVVAFDGRTLQFPWCRDDQAVSQAQRNADWVRRFIHGYAPDTIPIQPLIVVPGWYVKTSGNFVVKAMNAVYLVRFLTAESPTFSEDQLRALRCRFDERCRDVEF